jgi:hypothetical protein
MDPQISAGYYARQNDGRKIHLCQARCTEVVTMSEGINEEVTPYIPVKKIK